MTGHTSVSWRTALPPPAACPALPAPPPPPQAQVVLVDVEGVDREGCSAEELRLRLQQARLQVLREVAELGVRRAGVLRSSALLGTPLGLQPAGVEVAAGAGGCVWQHWSAEQQQHQQPGPPQQQQQQRGDSGQATSTGGLQVVEYVLGSWEQPAVVAQQLFVGLRAVDEVGVEAILVEGVWEVHEGLAVMNRLRKAAGRTVKL